jgi:predicted enzyme related to lactoylglutathione lyase
LPEAKTAKNRVHLDVPVPGATDDLEGVVERLTAKGATFVDHGSHPGNRWAVMQDPEGNEFCIGAA